MKKDWQESTENNPYHKYKNLDKSERFTISRTVGNFVSV